jgi:hypothetical protein
MSDAETRSRHRLSGSAFAAGDRNPGFGETGTADFRETAGTDRFCSIRAHSSTYMRRFGRWHTMQ